MVLCGRYDRSRFVDVAYKLRLLNAARCFGFSLSFSQLEDLSVESLVNRLIALGQWALAIEVCAFMRIEAEKGVYKVLAYWCRAIMDEFKKDPKLGGLNSKMNQNELAEKIVIRLNEYPGVSYAGITFVKNYFVIFLYL